MLRLLACFLLLAASAAQGQLQWQFPAGGAVAGNPLVHEGSVCVAGGSKLHVLDTNGAWQWAYDATAPTRSTVAVADGVVYLLADNGLHAVDLAGQRQWLFETGDGPLEVAGTTMGWGEADFIGPWAWYRSTEPFPSPPSPANLAG